MQTNFDINTHCSNSKLMTSSFICLFRLVQINIPFGTRSFSSFHVYQSGIILLGNSNERANTLTRPFIGNALRRGLGILSCFWDNLAPIPGSGGVFYQVFCFSFEMFSYLINIYFIYIM